MVRTPKRLHRLNSEIRVPEVRVLDEEGECLGVMTVSQALQAANEREVDLVEVSPSATPPVCKLIDYGKMLYSLQKKEQKTKKSANQEMKGIRLTFRIDSGDLERQRGNAEEFLSAGHPVRIQMMMRGRERAHKDLALEKMKAFVASLAEVSVPESEPRATGNQIITVLKPQKS